MPIHATKLGPGSAAKVDGSTRLRIADSVFDDWTPIALECADGTEDEDPAEFIARARADREARRPGHEEAIEEACRAAGASQVVVLGSDRFGDALDHGLNFIYVGDDGFSTPDGLLKAVRLKLDSVVVAGCDFQVFGMQPIPVSVALAISLQDDPGKFDTVGIGRDVVATVVNDFEGRKDFWLFREDAIGAAVKRASDVVHDVDVATTPSEPAAGFTFDSLPRYILAPADITISFSGPQ